MIEQVERCSGPPTSKATHRLKPSDLGLLCESKDLKVKTLKIVTKKTVCD